MVWENRPFREISPDLNSVRLLWLFFRLSYSRHWISCGLPVTEILWKVFPFVLDLQRLPASLRNKGQFQHGLLHGSIPGLTFWKIRYVVLMTERKSKKICRNGVKILKLNRPFDSRKNSYSKCLLAMLQNLLSSGSKCVGFPNPGYRSRWLVSLTIRLFSFIGGLSR
jgi:hypothetical protein